MDKGLIFPAVLIVLGVIGMVVGTVWMVHDKQMGQYITRPSGYSVMMQRLPNGHLDVSCG